ncbi:MAG: hypothetical protein KDD73_14015 [Anaerolineales bacterium]|nr:hypothetical protein [Anaerolineales bacterium]MCB9126991.1 hypothetical protein [Ardenticatenales bacterium]
MLDWDIREEELPPDTATAPSVRRRRGRWLLLLLPLLLIAGALLLWRSRIQDEALRADLQAFIDQEERARSFGLVDEAANFAVGNASERWLAGYRYRFERNDNDPPLPSVVVEEVTLRDRGNNALVTVRMDAHTRLRSYRLTRAGWRRAPLSRNAWGGEQRIDLGDGVTLRYWAIDADFAEQFAADWPALANSVDTRPLDEIVIEPVEFRTAAHYDEDSNRLQLASPQLVAYDDWLSGEELVRWSAAEAQWATPSRTTRSQWALQNGLTHSINLDWALVPDRMEALRDLWRASAAEQPLRMLPPERYDGINATFFDGLPAAVDGDGALLLIWADLIRSVSADHGNAAISSLRNRDDFWENYADIVGESARATAQRVDRYIAGGLAGALALDPIPVPMQFAEMGRADWTVSDDEAVPFVSADSDGVMLEMGRSRLSLGDGTTLPGACATLLDEVHVEGRWDERRPSTVIVDRLSVDGITINPTLSIPKPAPPGSALLIARQEVQRDASQPAKIGLEAVDQNGEATLLFGDYYGNRSVTQLDGWPNYAIQLHAAPPCEATWLYLLDVDGEWMGPWWFPDLAPWYSAVFTMDEAEGERLLVTGGNQNHFSAWRLNEGEKLAEHLEQLDDQLGFPIGWRAPSAQLVVISAAEPLQPFAISLDGAVETIQFSEEARQIAQTSGWAFDAAAYNPIFVLPNGGIELYSLADGALRTLLPASEDSEWQRYPLHIADEQQLVWIYEFNFSEGESGTLLALGFDGQEIARYTVGGNSWPLFGFCPNGDMLVGQLADGATPSTEEAEITIYRATADGISELLTTSMGSNAPNIVCLINE